MRNKFLSLLLLFVLALNAAAQQSAVAPQPAVDRLRADVTFLASDKLDGRRTGTDGANLAGRYIAAELKRLGLKPGAKGFMQTFPYVAGVELGANNVLAVKPNSGKSAITLHAGEDWMPLGFSSNSKIEDVQVVYVKHGITAKDLNHDDYANVDAKNKVVIALDGTPDGDNPHGQFARYADPRWKAIAARDKGAKALVLLSQVEKFGDDRLSSLRYDNAGEAGLPIIILGKPAAYRLLNAIFDVNHKKPGPCGASTKMADGTEVTPCGEFKVIKTPDGKIFLESPDGEKSPLGPDGKVQVTKFLGPETYEGTTWSLSTDVTRRSTAAANIIGVLEGSDPSLKNETIVIGAHYDHLGRGGEGSLAPRSSDIHHGADDNASGVAGMLELARMFSRKGMRPKRTLVFIAFSGEEEGLLGSNYYVNHPIVPLAQTVAMVNMDMIGRLNDNKLIVGGVGTSTVWREMIASANQGMPVLKTSASHGPQPAAMTTSFDLTLNEDGFGPSDHSSFYSKQVPVLFFWTGTHMDYHKPSDTADKISYEGEARIVSMVESVVRAIDGNERRPVYAVAKSESTGRTMGFKVSLGTIPNYAESENGLKLDGVRDSSPAARAGLVAGDVIVKLAGREIKNVYDYTYALGEMKAGEVYEVELMRNGQRLSLKIIPDARK